jgi:uracil-DNA glycosylase
MMTHPIFRGVHPSWQPVLDPIRDSIIHTFESISSSDFIPGVDRILAPLHYPLEEVRVVIVGQDPYPNPDYADGFAFSVRPEVTPFPASLTNILKELESDLGISLPKNGNLERWSAQGVMLINRTLTTIAGQSHAHQRSGWLEISEVLIGAVASRGSIGILWGGNAHQLSDLFEPTLVIKSAHPSPLSAYRGFFGSRPFSHANSLLEERGLAPIQW